MYEEQQSWKLEGKCLRGVVQRLLATGAPRICVYGL